MKDSNSLVLACLLATLPLGAVAEIYQSEDSQGNAVFSDVPSSGAEEVELEEANIADEPPEMPDLPPSDTGGDDEPNIYVIPNTHNEKVESEWREGERRDVREAEERREVRQAEERHVVE